MPQTEHGILLLFILPLITVIGVSLNLMIRARGGRSFALSLKGFGIDLTVTSTPQATSKKRVGTTVDKEV